MLTAELLRTVRRIEIKTRHLVSESLAGEYHAVFKGRGMAFDEVRPYQPGDEVRSIDWNVTARTGEPHVKRYVEERELTVLLLVDTSGSLSTGSRGRAKRRLAAELAAVLAFSATTNNDRVGLIQFGGRLERVIPPRKGRRHVLRLVRELLASPPSPGGSDLGAALDTLHHLQRRRGIVFLISDFAGPAHPGLHRRKLLSTSRRHDLIAFELREPDEGRLPPAGILWLEDAETGQRVPVDSLQPAVRAAIAERSQAERQAVDRAFRDAGVDRVEIETVGDYTGALVRFFAGRVRRKARR